ncbi:hypothetical protein J6590_041680 [Homalodisca vitripennis]|nr:hypothetical protein J6590_041680 [Homalodisca vitripennis]
MPDWENYNSYPHTHLITRLKTDVISGDEVRGCSLRMPRGGCSALPRTVDTGVARYEAFASHNVRRAMCLSVLEQCSKVPRSELCVKWIPALSASHHTRQFCTANQ